jgi:uncharacterized repeat protein (TIGR01451 family)
MSNIDTMISLRAEVQGWEATATMRSDVVSMTSPKRARTSKAGLVALLTLACWAISPWSAEALRGDLIVTGSAAPEPAGTGSQVTYTVNIKNDSTVTATGVLVTMDLPDGAQFLRCTPTGLLCNQSAGIVTTTFATLGAHTTVRVNLVVQMPAVSQEVTLSLGVLAHADAGINGGEPRDGHLTITSTVLPVSTRLLMSPSGRIVQIACGSTVDAAVFGADIEGQLLDGLICTNGSGLTFTASGKTLNLGGKKIFSGVRVKGNTGLIVGPNAPNVTIKGGGTEGTKGIEQFEYCLKDLGGNTNLLITGLRCFRAKAVGILSLSNGVLISSSLVDRTTPDSSNEIPVEGGIGIQAGGDNIHVQNTEIRRTGCKSQTPPLLTCSSIGFWAYGVDTDGSGLAATYDGASTITSRIESNSGVGVLLSKGPHKIKDTQVEGDDSQTGTSKEGIVVAADAPNTVLDGVVVKKHRGHAIRVEAGATGTLIARTSVEDIGGSGYVINAPSTLNGNSAQLVAGDAFVINASAVLTSNTVENCPGNAFVINAAADVNGNSAVDNGGYGFVITNTTPASMGTGWAIEDIGDFNHDGKADILWRHTSGLLHMWLMDGERIVDARSVASVGTDWTVQGVGDFNGDGKADILWRHTSGLVFIWLMDGPNIISTGSLGVVGTDWTIVGIGDFDRDGKADILWRHTSGLVYAWLIDGTTFVDARAVASVGTDWTIQEVGDFNGDGKADILWRHTSGLVFIWLMDGPNVIISTASLGLIGTDWQIQSVGDFDGDGKADILWRHTSGLVFVWLMDGQSVLSTASPGSLGADWSIQGVGDFNNDRKADIFWRRTSDELSTWFMSGMKLLNAAGAAHVRTNTAEGNREQEIPGTVTLGGGFLVSGSGNVLESNSAKTNGNAGPEPKSPGFNVTGSRNLLTANRAERSGGPEFMIGANNIDGGSNLANGTRFSFPTAGGPFE